MADKRQSLSDLKDLQKKAAEPKVEAAAPEAEAGAPEAETAAAAEPIETPSPAPEPPVSTMFMMPGVAPPAFDVD